MKAICGRGGNSTARGPSSLCVPAARMDAGSGSPAKGLESYSRDHRCDHCLSIMRLPAGGKCSRRHEHERHATLAASGSGAAAAAAVVSALDCRCGQHTGRPLLQLWRQGRAAGRGCSEGSLRAGRLACWRMLGRYDRCCRRACASAQGWASTDATGCSCRLENRARRPFWSDQILPGQGSVSLNTLNLGPGMTCRWQMAGGARARTPLAIQPALNRGSHSSAQGMVYQTEQNIASKEVLSRSNRSLHSASCRCGTGAAEVSC